MRRMTRFCVVLLLVVIVPTGSLVRAQDSGDVITVTGLYSSNTQGEYQDILVPCGSLQVVRLYGRGRGCLQSYEASTMGEKSQGK